MNRLDRKKETAIFCGAFLYLSLRGASSQLPDCLAAHDNPEVNCCNRDLSPTDLCGTNRDQFPQEGLAAWISAIQCSRQPVPSGFLRGSWPERSGPVSLVLKSIQKSNAAIYTSVFSLVHRRNPLSAEALIAPLSLLYIGIKVSNQPRFQPNLKRGLVSPPGAFQ